jgi:hypothetical protein
MSQNGRIYGPFDKRQRLVETAQDLLADDPDAIDTI